MRLVPIPQPGRAAVTIQTAPFGTTNPAALTTRGLPLPATLNKAVAFAREQFSGPDAGGLRRLQDKILAALANLQQLPDANGNMIRGVAFTSGAQLAVSHGLGQTWVGYRVVNVQGAGATFFATPTPATDNGTIQLTASATCLADVWVYC
jgi:hypothetical protein